MIDDGLIDAFERGGAQLRAAFAGLTRDALLAKPADGSWSIQQIVVHLMDSDGVGIERMKRVIAMDRPLLVGYDESRFAQLLHYDDQPADEAIELFDRNRRLFAKVLRKLPADIWTRSGIHTESGVWELGEHLNGYVEHLEHHLRFIEKKRKMLE